MEDERTWYLYLLECSDGTLYTGITVDTERRVRCHNAGRGARYTRTRLPVKLIGYKVVCNHAEALRQEKKLKTRTPRVKREFFR